VLGYKRYETRQWLTGHRGRLLIHASRGVGDHQRRLFETPEIKAFFEEHGYLAFADLPRGAIARHVPLPRAITTEEPPDLIDDKEKAVGDCSINRYAFRLEKPVAYADPTPASGKLGIWELPDGQFAHLAHTVA